MAKDKRKEEKNEKEEKREEKKLVPPYPDGMDVDYFGEKGEYTFDIHVFSDLGKGIKAKIRIIEGDKKRDAKETDEFGFLEYPAEKFQEEEREFFFRVLGFDVHEEVVLDGPKPKKGKQPKIGKPKFIAGGFIANFRNVKQFYEKKKEEEKNE